MLVNWLRKLFSAKTQPLSARRSGKRPLRLSSFRPNLDLLEDRLAPAVVGTLSQAGQYLIYTSAVGTHNVNISGNAGSILISDTAAASTDTITSTVTGIPSASATTGVTGTIPAAVTTIMVNNGSGFDTLTIPAAGFVTARNITSTANLFAINGNLETGGISFATRSGGLIQLNGGLLDSVQTPAAGSIYLNGPVTFGAAAHIINTNSATDGDLMFYSNVTGGAGGVTINAAVPTLPAQSTGNVTFLGPVALSGALSIGTAAPKAGANNITFYNAATITGNVLLEAEQAISLSNSLSSNGTIAFGANNGGLGSYGFSQGAGSVSTSNASATAITLNVNTASAGTGSAQIRSFSTGTGGTTKITVAGTGGSIINTNGSALNISGGAGSTASLQANNGSISLNTSVANLDVVTFGVGNITIANSGLALAIDASGVKTTNGNVSISNTANITLTGNVTAQPTPSKTVTLTTTGGSITGTGTVSAATVNLNATAGVGVPAATPTSIVIATPATVNAFTNTGGIGLVSANALTIGAALAQAGEIDIVTTGAHDLNIAGNVGTTGSNINLVSGQSLNITGNSAVANSGGNLAFTDALNFSENSIASITTSGSFTLTAGAAATVEAFNGTLTATGAVTINGSTGAATTLSVDGALTTGSTLTINDTGTGADFFSFAAPVTATGNVTVDGGGNATAATLALEAPFISQGSVEFFGTHGLAGGSLTMLQSAGATLSGTSVDIQGGTGSNQLTLSGPLVATTGGISFGLNAAGSAANLVSISGQLAALTGTLIDTSVSGSDIYLITPSASSALTFNVGAASINNNLILEKTNFATDIASGLTTDPETFTANATITFNTPPGYQPITLTIALGGSITVSTAS